MAPQSEEQILAVYVRHEDLWFTCQWRDEAGGFTCGKCGLGALGTEPKQNDTCNVCHAPVAEVRHGPASPSPLFTGLEERQW